jgi:hypothetical protein
MKRLITGWHFVRLLRLVLGVAILVQGILVRDVTSMVLGALFGLMAVVNVGCCGEKGCSVSTMSDNKTRRKINYEELDTKQ